MKNHFSLFFQEGFHGLWGIRQTVFTFQNVKFRLSDVPVEDTISLVSKSRFCTLGDFFSLYHEELVAPITINTIHHEEKQDYLPPDETEVREPQRGQTDNWPCKIQQSHQERGYGFYHHLRLWKYYHLVPYLYNKTNN